MNLRLIVFSILLVITAEVRAASAEFQDFLTRACESATPGTDFFTRCNIDSVDGDLSGDSEDSLNPTQSLANASSAIAETRARIKALREKMAESKLAAPEEEEDDAKDVFRQSGFSLIMNGESGDIDREQSTRERGFDTDTTRIQVGFDYRASNTLIAGAVVSFEQFDTVYDADQPGVNFDPGPTEGDTERDSLSVNLFASLAVSERLYFDALLSVSQSDFVFRRIAIFQESTRTLPTLTINTSAESEGQELAASVGMGYNANWDAVSLHSYLRVNFQRSSIDPYEEQGGRGFAMFIENDDLAQSTAVAGFRLTRSINTSFGVLVPQIFAEYESTIDRDDKVSRQRFIADPSRTFFTVVGDEEDDSFGRGGIGLLAIFPNGFSAFVTADTVWGRTLFDETRINAGIRKEL